MEKTKNKNCLDEISSAISGYEKTKGSGNDNQLLWYHKKVKGDIKKVWFDIIDRLKYYNYVSSNPVPMLVICETNE